MSGLGQIRHGAKKSNAQNQHLHACMACAELCSTHKRSPQESSFLLQVLLCDAIQVTVLASSHAISNMCKASTSCALECTMIGKFQSALQLILSYHTSLTPSADCSAIAHMLVSSRNAQSSHRLPGRPTRASAELKTYWLPCASLYRTPRCNTDVTRQAH